jgi:hypothetical protein
MNEVEAALKEDAENFPGLDEELNAERVALVKNFDNFLKF